MKPYHETRFGVLYHADCLDILNTMPEKSVDLVLTDPPYGINAYATGTMGGGVLAKQSKYDKTDWDGCTPSKEALDKAISTAINSIIFGGNYFDLPPSSCWLVWDKQNGDNNFADCELAWTSFKTAVRIYRYRWQGMLQGNMKDKEKRYHPTQKPTPLFVWILNNYSNEEMTVLDPFAGSGTTAVACIKTNRKYILIEKEKDYCDIIVKRIEDELDQTDIFRDNYI